MEKIKIFAKKYTLLYCIMIEVFLIAFLIGEGTLIAHLVPKGNYYVSFFIQEAIGAIVACGLLQMSGLKMVLTNRGSGFWKGLLVGMYLLVISLFSIFRYVGIYTGKKHLQAWYIILIYIACMICVGITEEFVFRGIIATLLLKKFSTSRFGIWRAVVVSGKEYSPAMAGKILNQYEEHSWIPGPVIAGTSVPLSEEDFNELYETNETIKPGEEILLRMELPRPEQLIKPEQFNDIVQQIKELKEYSFEGRAGGRRCGQASPGGRRARRREAGGMGAPPRRV
jgi:hypothetical protein